MFPYPLPRVPYPYWRAPWQTNRLNKLPKREETKKKKFKFIRWDDSGVVAHLTLNRPKQNVMNIGMLREIAPAIDSFSTREDVRLILLDASPECEGYFSLGVGAEGYTQQMVFQMMDAFHNVFRAMIDVSKPVLAVVEGVASGAGAELAAFCDLVIATEKCPVSPAGNQAGSVSAHGSSCLSARHRAAPRHGVASDRRSHNAFQAQQMGLVNRA